MSTYGAIAKKIGHPKAARAVGRALGSNPIPIVIPCHRVIGASGALTGYAGGLDRKVASSSSRACSPRPDPGWRPPWAGHTLRDVELTVDVLVVGARVAGSITAALLAEAGYRVLLVDRARFPSSTLSTHFFRGGRLCSVLVSLGVLDDVLALGSPPLICDYNYEGDDPTPDVSRRRIPATWGSRSRCGESRSTIC